MEVNRRLSGPQSRPRRGGEDNKIPSWPPPGGGGELNAGRPAGKKVKIKLSLCLNKHRVMKRCEGVSKFPDWLPGARNANGTALCH
jgi:hypothetical protein